MEEFSAMDREVRKRAVFEAMSSRRQHQITKRGYENWDPFQEPKDPIEIRRDSTQRTAGQLLKEFLASRSSTPTSEAYGQAALEMAMGMVRKDDRILAMYEFSCWYRNLLESQGLDTMLD
jgi:hypothetical protein